MRRVAAILALALFAVAAAPRAVLYNKKVTFRTGEVLRFPRFTLEYIGITSPGIPQLHLAPTHGFRVRRATETITVNWSTGTGVIGPAEFKIGGRTYWIELARSEQYGWLKSDEMVVVPK
ncbi:MAG TPA: hypothetical protein VGQ46_08515 [Thermoanaerobaculia bacterium]|jgi:hypothetical protein|nr:hypothetical protein [Thermoanaerobaculia bacterium]